MNLTIFISISTLLLSTNAMYYNQDKMYKIDDYKSFLNDNKSTDNHREMELYFEAIKETFDLYYRDEKYKHGKVCKSNQHRLNIGDFSKSYTNLKENFNKNCSYVIGSVVIAYITDEDISFLNSIEEISGYLFVYSNSIESISLNNLKVIRGENPLLLHGKKFSLSIGHNFFKNKALKYLLMPNLQVILRHNVLFYSNPDLCYASRKINWDSLMGRNQKVLIAETNQNACAVNNKTTEELNCHPSCQKYSNKQYCWSNASLSCQKINDCTQRNCSELNKCYKNEILKTEECCHDECAGGCTGPLKTQCLACKNFNNNGSCLENCPRQFLHDGMRYNKNPDGKLAFNYICVEKCPIKFFNEHGNCVTKCTTENTYGVNQTCVPCPNRICPKLCRAKDIVKKNEIDFLHRETLDRLENCTVYDGNIVINQLSVSGDLFHDLTQENHGIRKEDLKKLENLREIYGYLKISVGGSANWMDSLDFLKNLQIIRAETHEEGFDGLSISHNEGLKYLGLKNLKKVTNGNLIITANVKLCFADTLSKDSIIYSKNLFISKNGQFGNCRNKTCHKECQQQLGCWGPKKYHCVKCKNYIIPESKICLSNCSKLQGYFFNPSNNNKLYKSCSKCHSECKLGINTCYGSEGNQCNLGCKNYKFNGYCVLKCPFRHYSDNSKERNCHPCHSTCTYIKNYSSKPICSGPDNFIGNNGCSLCNHVLLNSNDSIIGKYSNSSQILECLNNSDICPKGSYKSIVDLRFGIKSKLDETGLENVNRVLQKWINKETNHDFPIASACLPCHPYCLECTGRSNWHCGRCKYFRSDNKCIEKCPKEYFINYNANQTETIENECVKCHEECEGGCTGLTEYDCKKCRHAKIYINASTHQFFCNSTCGDKMQMFKTSEIICIDNSTSDKFTLLMYYGGPVAFFMFLLLIYFIFKISNNKKMKAFNMNMKYLNDFYTTETGTNSGVMPNMATLLLITESQLTREEIIGSGAFGIVYKGIWQPNIDAIDKSSSFLKRNLSKLSQDTSIKLNVAVKILTDISDPANNRELLEEAKVMASVDHPCCLRILAVCLTAHPKLITQFMPLGSLLEFCQRNRPLINNITLLIWAKQIACGMEYLEAKGIIHCDLAARNVLIQSPRQVKITDFGLAKMLDYSQHQYQFKGGRMPIKWLAMECIRNRIFSSKSDVWSYGVTLWEMFTFGEKPFSDIKAYDILEYLEKGQRLNQPKICSIDAYTILVQCWLVDPDARPSFTELRKTFEMMVNNPNRYLLIQDEDSTEPFYVDWENDAQKYDEFLQALVTVSHINSSYESAATKPIERKHIKSVKNRYQEMRAYKNCFINNEIYNDTNEKRDKSNSTNPDYTAIVFQGKYDSNQSGSTWLEYFENKMKCTSNCTMMTNINSNNNDSIKKEILETDLSEDGYLIPKSNCKKELANNPNEKVVYLCEETFEKEVLINHESSI